MVTIQYIVNKELEKTPILLDLLEEGLLNVTAIAIKISPQVIEKLGKQVKISAISMAIRRFPETSLLRTATKWKFPKNVEIATKSKIYEVAIEKTSVIPSIINRLHKEIKKEKGEFLSIVEGTYEFLIFTNQSHKVKIKKILHGHTITSEQENLAYITVNWAKDTKNIPGIYYQITRALAFKGISIQAFHTIGSEMMLFFKEDVFLDAYQTLATLLKANKKA